MWTIVWIFLSFFAVIGIVEFVFSLIEAFSMYRTKTVGEIFLSVEMAGEEPHVDFVLSSLSIIAERISINQKTAKVQIKDKGMSEKTLRDVRAYIRQNEGVILIEKEGDV